jgi:outer membrane immunogenic protein
MKQAFLAALGGIALVSGSALAADLPNQLENPVAPVAFAPVLSWTGVYTGVNVGGDWQRNRCFTQVGFNGLAAGQVVAGWSNWPVAFCGTNNSNTGFIGGGQVGYNYQIGGLVLGVETDIDYLGSECKNGISQPFFYGDPAGPTVPQPAAGPFTSGITGHAGDPASGYYQIFGSKNRNDALGTVRLRAGYAVDRGLFFITGGLAHVSEGASQSWCSPTGERPVWVSP